jgi:hypothetical protein
MKAMFQAICKYISRVFAAWKVPPQPQKSSTSDEHPKVAEPEQSQTPPVSYE